MGRGFERYSMRARCAQYNQVHHWFCEGTLQKTGEECQPVIRDLRLGEFVYDASSFITDAGDTICPEFGKGKSNMKYKN